MEQTVHQKLCQVLQSKSKSKLVLLPRGTFKTCIATISFPVQLILNNPNIRIAIDNEVYANSQSYLKEIKQHFESNKELRGVYGDYVAKKGWLEEQITVSKRTAILKEPTALLIPSTLRCSNLRAEFAPFAERVPP